MKTVLSLKWIFVLLLTIALACAPCSFISQLVPTEVPVSVNTPQADPAGATAVPSAPASPGSDAAPYLPQGLAQITTANVARLQEVGQVPATKVVYLDFSPDGRLLVTVSLTDSASSRRVTVWNLVGGTALASLEAWQLTPASISSPQGEFLVALLPCSSINFSWQPASTAALNLISADSSCSALSPDASRLVMESGVDAGDETSTMSILDTNSGATIKSFTIRGQPFRIAFSADSRLVAISPGGGMDVLPVTIWDLSNGAQVAEMRDLSGVSFSPDGALLAGEYDYGDVINVLRTSDWFTVGTVGSLDGATGMGQAKFLADGSLLAALDSYQLGLWEMQGWMKVNTIGNNLSGYALAPDGKAIALVDYMAPAVTLWGVP